VGDAGRGAHLEHRCRLEAALADGGHGEVQAAGDGAGAQEDQDVDRGECDGDGRLALHQHNLLRQHEEEVEELALAV
jgi:hypothetical protein